MPKVKLDNTASAPPEYHLILPDRKSSYLSGFSYINGRFQLFVQSKDVISKEIKVSIFESTDIINWTELKMETVFSNREIPGSSSFINDVKNTSGLGTLSKPPVICIYSDLQSNTIKLSYSLDPGSTWEAYKKNPILSFAKSKVKSIYVFWHDPSARWILVVTLPTEFMIHFYSSKNLIKWDFLNDFGGHPSFKYSWENAFICPISLQSTAGGTKWILVVTTKNDFSAVRYFVGEFDGKHFLCDHALDKVLLIDNNKDFLAPEHCTGLFPKRNLLMATAINTVYADHLPQEGWKSMFTAPREITLLKEADGSLRLSQRFATELQSIRANEQSFEKSTITNDLEWDLALSSAMEFELKIECNKICSIEFDFGAKTKIFVTWDVRKRLLSIDRTARPLGFHPDYNSFDSAPISSGHTLQIHILFDKYSIEVLADNGKVSFTSLLFPINPLQRFRIIGKQFVASGKVWQLIK
ncbi:MAG: GH32 C-terminal domain-containing protein [Saprospiraceae bacterium]